MFSLLSNVCSLYTFIFNPFSLFQNAQTSLWQGLICPFNPQSGYVIDMSPFLQNIVAWFECSNILQAWPHSCHPAWWRQCNPQSTGTPHSPHLSFWAQRSGVEESPHPYTFGNATGTPLFFIIIAQKNCRHFLPTVTSHLNAITQNHFTQLYITIRYYTIKNYRFLPTVASQLNLTTCQAMHSSEL